MRLPTLKLDSGSLSTIPSGIVASRFGRKRIILLRFILFAILYYGFAVVKDVMIIWFLFGLYGIVMGLTEGIQKAFLSTIIPPDFKATAFGIYNITTGIAMFPASLIGGWLWDNISPSSTFYYGSITAGLSAFLFIIFITMIRRDNLRILSSLLCKFSQGLYSQCFP